MSREERETEVVDCDLNEFRDDQKEYRRMSADGWRLDAAITIPNEDIVRMYFSRRRSVTAEDELL